MFMCVLTAWNITVGKLEALIVDGGRPRGRVAEKDGSGDKALAAKPERTSSISRAHNIEGNNWLLHVILRPPDALWHMCTCTHTHTQN